MQYSMRYGSSIEPAANLHRHHILGQSKSYKKNLIQNLISFLKRYFTDLNLPKAYTFGTSKITI